MDPRSEYESGREGIFNIRYPKDEKAILERYVPRMLGEAWGSMKTHYMFAPPRRCTSRCTLDREHFSVRTSGLPNIGIEGVCFGHVVAAMSPKSEPFNWGNVLWHELAHVFAIQLSKNHVPRWFTEGLCEYETMIRRPEWQRELDPELYLALKKNQLPGAVDMNRAFTHAEGDLDVTVAYYAASQMLAFTAEQFGFAKITRALCSCGARASARPTSSARRSACRAQDYDARFRAWAMARLSRYDGQYMFDPKTAPLEDAKAAAAATPAERRGSRRLRAGAPAREQGRRRGSGDRRGAASSTRPTATPTSWRPSSPRRLEDTAAQEKHLRAIKAAGGDGYTVEMALAEVAEARKDNGAASGGAGGRASLRSDAGRCRCGRSTSSRPATSATPTPWSRCAKWRGSTSTTGARRSSCSRRSSRPSSGTRRGASGEAAIYVDVESAEVHVDYARALAATGDHADGGLRARERPPVRRQAARAGRERSRSWPRERLALGDAAGARPPSATRPSQLDAEQPTRSAEARPNAGTKLV